MDKLLGKQNDKSKLLQEICIALFAYDLFDATFKGPVWLNIHWGQCVSPKVPLNRKFWAPKDLTGMNRLYDRLIDASSKKTMGFSLNMPNSSCDSIVAYKKTSAIKR